MFKSLKQLFQEAVEFKLSGDEKSLIKSRLQNHVRNDYAPRHYVYRSKLKIFKLTFIKPMPIFIVILLALGGTSFAAEKTLPGDVLYPIKLNVNENFQGWLSLSDEAKANWETMLLNRRLKEAEELAVNSKLDLKTEAKIEENFQRHADKVQEHIAKLEKVDAKVAADVSANLQTSLEAHNRILININTSNEGDAKSQLKAIMIKVKAEAKNASDDRVKNENEVKAGTNVQSAAEGRLNSVENKLAEVQKYIEKKKSEISAEVMVQIQAQLKIVTDLIAQGKAKLSVKEFDQAFTLFGQAKAKAQEVKLLIEAKTDLEDESENEDEDKDDDRDDDNAEVRIENNRGSGKIKIDIGP